MTLLEELRAKVLAQLQTIVGATVKEEFALRPDQKISAPTLFVRRAGWGPGDGQPSAIRRRLRLISVSIWAFAPSDAALDQLIADVAAAIEVAPGTYALTKALLKDTPTLVSGDDRQLGEELRVGFPEGIAIQAQFPCETPFGTL